MDQSLNWIENFEIKQIQVVCFYKCKKMIVLAESLSYYNKKLKDHFKLISGMIFFSYLTDFIYNPLKMVFRKLLDTFRTGKKMTIYEMGCR
jgi:hypothetical protein